MKNKSSYIYASAISFIFMCLIIITAFMFTVSLKNASSQQDESRVIYVYKEPSVHETETNSSPYFIKEKDGKIGIFNADGELIKIIDTHIKTLPEAEKAAIEEGFAVSSEKELYSIIEAYTD